MHPGRSDLLRIIGQGRWQHPFHSTATTYASWRATETRSWRRMAPPGGAAAVHDQTTPGLRWIDFLLERQGPELGRLRSPCRVVRSARTLTALRMPTGYKPGICWRHYYEWCQDHNKPMEAPNRSATSGEVARSPCRAELVHQWCLYGGSPIWADATVRSAGPTDSTPPSGTIANPPTSEAGFAFMWHSHNEREITTNNIFPAAC